MSASPLTISKLATAAKTFLKSIDGAPLEDLIDVTSNTEPHQNTTVPTAEQIGASTHVYHAAGHGAKDNSTYNELHPQGPREVAFEGLSRLLGGVIEKSILDLRVELRRENQGLVKSLVAALAKAEDDKDDKDKDDEFKKAEAAKAAAATVDPIAAAFRKARIAVAKASDTDDDDDDDAVEKAESALAVVRTEVAKAEDDAKDDEDERKAEKARADLKTLRSSLAKAKASLAARKEAAEKARNTDPIAAEKAKLDEFQAKIDDVAKSMKMDMGQVMDFLRGRDTAAVAKSGIQTAPTVAKSEAAAAAPVRDADAIARKISRLELDAEPIVISKANALLNRFQRAKLGHFDMSLVDAEIAAADPVIQAIFTPTAAAA